MEAINQAQEKIEFKAPATKADFPDGQTKIEHIYDNGNKVVFLLLSNGSVATIREGIGEDVEKATMEAGGDRAKWMTAAMASCVKINGKGVNMFELAKIKFKDFTALQAEFTELNF